jgi:hypothetical protein
MSKLKNDTEPGKNMADETVKSSDQADVILDADAAPEADTTSHEDIDQALNTKTEPDVAEPDGDNDTPNGEDTTSPAPAPATPEPPKEKSTFVPMLLGGIICAGLGFGAAVLTQQQSPLWPKDAAQIEFETATRATLEDVATKISALDARPTPDVTAADLSAATTEVNTTLSRVGKDIAALSDQITQLDERLSALEKSTIESAIPDDLVAKYRAEIESINEYLATQRTELQGFMEDAKTKAQAAEDAARAATLRGALDKISVAMDSGLGFGDVLDDLSQALDGSVPAELSTAAENGVATISDLSKSFGTAARDALATARSEMDQGQGLAKLGNFLKSQFNARSVTPKDGDDPDAILSRAEAAVRQGKLSEALAEISKLSTDAQAQMSEWMDAAKTRVAASDAVNSLLNELGQ